jgi:hypothetical protein
VNYVDLWGLTARDTGSVPIITGISGALPLVGKVDTGNWVGDSLLAGVGNVWNTVASVANIVTGYAGNLANATDSVLTMADDLVSDKYSLTGSGLREDLYVISLFAGMNPGMVAEGVQHAKNFLTVVQSSLSRNSSISTTVQYISDWLGDDVQTKINGHGDRVFLSADGEKRVRFDLNYPNPHNNPHGHIEELVNGQWIKSGPIFFADVPHN